MPALDSPSPRRVTPTSSVKTTHISAKTPALTANQQKQPDYQNEAGDGTAEAELLKNIRDMIAAFHHSKENKRGMKVCEGSPSVSSFPAVDLSRLSDTATQTGSFKVRPTQDPGRQEESKDEEGEGAVMGGERKGCEADISPLIEVPTRGSLRKYIPFLMKLFPKNYA